MASGHLEAAYTRRITGGGNHLGNYNVNGSTVRSTQQSWQHTARLNTGWGGSPNGRKPHNHPIPGYIGSPSLDRPVLLDAQWRAARGRQ